MKKRFNLILEIVAILAVLSITACTHKAMSEDELKEEVQEKLYDKLSDDMEITSFTVGGALL